MRVTENRGLRYAVLVIAGGMIGTAFNVVSQGRRIAALEARPPVRREWVIEKMHGIDPVEFERFHKQGSDDSGDNAADDKN